MESTARILRDMSLQQLREQAFTLQQLREHAAREGVDARTLAKYLRGQKVRGGLVLERCRAAAAALLATNTPAVRFLATLGEA